MADPIGEALAVFRERASHSVSDRRLAAWVAARLDVDGRALLESAADAQVHEANRAEFPARFLAWLVADPVAGALTRECGLRLRGASLSGRLDLQYLRYGKPLVLEDCDVPDGLDLRGAQFSLVDLSGARIGDCIAATAAVAGDFVAYGLDGGPLVLEDATIGGSLRLAGAQLRTAARHQRPPGIVGTAPPEAALAADRAQIKGRIDLCATGSGARFQADGVVYLRSAKVGGILDFKGGCFRGGLERRANGAACLAIGAESIGVGGPVYLGSHDGDDAAHAQPFEAVGKVDLSEATIDGSVWIGWQTAHDAAEQIAERRRRAAPGQTDWTARPHALFIAPAVGAKEARVALDLGRSTLKGHLNVFSSNIDGRFDLVNTSIKGSLSVVATACLGNRAPGGVDGESIYLDGAQVGDTIFIEHSRAEGMLSAIQARITNELYVANCVLDAPGQGRGTGVAVSLRGARIGYVSFTVERKDPGAADCVITGRINLAQAQIDTELRFAATAHRWSGAPPGDRALVTLDGAQIGGMLEMRPLLLGDESHADASAVYARGARIGRSARFGDLDPSQPPTVIHGAVVLTNAFLRADARWSNCRVVARGCSPVDISGSEIDGHVMTRESHFAFLASPSRAYGTPAFLGRDCVIKGSVCLNRASLFVGSIDLAGSKIAGNALFNTTRFDIPAGLAPEALHQFHVLNLARASIGGDWRWGRHDLESDGFRPRGIVNLGNAQIGRIDVARVWQPQWEEDGEVASYLRLGGCTYAQISDRSLERIDWERWVQLLDPQRFSVQPYEQLVRTLRSMGRHDLADRISHRKLREVRLHRVARDSGQTSSGYSIERAERERAILSGHRRTVVPAVWRRAVIPLAIGAWLWATLAVVNPAWFPAALRSPLQGFAHSVLPEIWPPRGGAIVALGVVALVLTIAAMANGAVRLQLSLLWGRFLDHVFGYGYKPMRAVAAVALLVVLGGAVFDHAARNHLLRASAEKERDKPVHADARFNPMLFSLETVVPVVALKQSQLWEIAPTAPAWLHAYRTFHYVLGYILVTGIALSPITIFRKD